MRDRFLLIGGCPRSGTSALFQLLNQAPEVYISSEENLIKLEDKLRDTLGTRERRSEISRGRNRDLSKRETLTLDLLNNYAFSVDCVWDLIAFTYRWHHAQKHAQAELKLWGDKFPNYFRHLERILSIDTARYIHITRNPLDVINSMIRRTTMAEQGRDWWKAITNKDEMIARWAEAHSIVCHYESNARVLHLHYEELIFNSQATLQRLEDFLCVELCGDSMLISDPAKHHERDYLDSNTEKQIFKHPEYKKYLARCAENSVPVY